jgi:NAD(P)-dependent dehydrogenase (short-subunit alcohol dehydrogenase family)
MSLAGAKVLVVGGSAGIGRALGVAAVRAGAEVVFAARRADKLDAAVADAGGGHAVVLDVCDEAGIDAAVEEAAAALGGIDVVVQDAGVARLARFTEVDAAQWREVLDTNVVGPSLVTRAVLPHLPAGAIVVFCSSTTDEQPRWGLAAYGASKAALNRVVDSYRAERPDVRFVRAVIGSTVGTEFGDGFDGELLQEAFARWIVNAQGTAQMMTTDDLVPVLVDLLTTLRAHPGVDLPRVDLAPTGGLLTLPPTPEIIATAYDALAAELAAKAAGSGA